MLTNDKYLDEGRIHEFSLDYVGNFSIGLEIFNNKEKFLKFTFLYCQVFGILLIMSSTDLCVEIFEIA